MDNAFVSSSPVDPIEVKSSTLTPFSAGKLCSGVASKRKTERKALIDRTNDSPIFGLAPGFGIPECRRSPYLHVSNLHRLKYSITSSENSSIGEDLLRSQVKSLLQKVDHEGSRFPVLRTLSQLNGFLSLPARKTSDCDPATPSLLTGQRSRLSGTITRYQECYVSNVSIQEEQHYNVELGLHSPDETITASPDVRSDAGLILNPDVSGEVHTTDKRTPNFLPNDAASKGTTRILLFHSPEKSPNSPGSAPKSFMTPNTESTLCSSDDSGMWVELGSEASGRESLRVEPPQGTRGPYSDLPASTTSARKRACASRLRA